MQALAESRYPLPRARAGEEVVFALPSRKGLFVSMSGLGPEHRVLLDELIKVLRHARGLCRVTDAL